mmetsp:Transcript_9516/g.30167  ORF Transcript_9516/g.30167 Transcript_9516/m.30167 type:complete len:270 (-) Transcript_9516:545-1354(-)
MSSLCPQLGKGESRMRHSLKGSSVHGTCDARIVRRPKHLLKRTVAQVQLHVRLPRPLASAGRRCVEYRTLEDVANAGGGAVSRVQRSLLQRYVVKPNVKAVRSLGQRFVVLEAAPVVYRSLDAVERPLVLLEPSNACLQCHGLGARQVVNADAKDGTSTGQLSLPSLPLGKGAKESVEAGDAPALRNQAITPSLVQRTDAVELRVAGKGGRCVCNGFLVRANRRPRTKQRPDHLVAEPHVVGLPRVREAGLERGGRRGCPAGRVDEPVP